MILVSLLSQKAGASKKKKSKRKEIKLEALSVSENFDPETYIIPLQNRWTIESELSRASDVSNNEEKYLITRRPIDDSVGCGIPLHFIHIYSKRNTLQFKA